MDNNIYLCSNLKYLRIINNKTLIDISKIVNKSNVAVHHWEQGTREPSSIDLAKLSNFYNISIDDLLLKNLKVESNVILDEHHKLDVMIQNKSQNLTEEGKKALINIIDNLSSIDNK